MQKERTIDECMEWTRVYLWRKYRFLSHIPEHQDAIQHAYVIALQGINEFKKKHPPITLLTFLSYRIKWGMYKYFIDEKCRGVKYGEDVKYKDKNFTPFEIRPFILNDDGDEHIPGGELDEVVEEAMNLETIERVDSIPWKNNELNAVQCKLKNITPTMSRQRAWELNIQVSNKLRRVLA